MAGSRGKSHGQRKLSYWGSWLDPEVSHMARESSHTGVHGWIQRWDTPPEKALILGFMAGSRGDTHHQRKLSYWGSWLDPEMRHTTRESSHTGVQGWIQRWDTPPEKVPILRFMAESRGETHLQRKFPYWGLWLDPEVRHTMRENSHTGVHGWIQRWDTPPEKVPILRFMVGHRSKTHHQRKLSYWGSWLDPEVRHTSRESSHSEVYGWIQRWDTPPEKVPILRFMVGSRGETHHQRKFPYWGLWLDPEVRHTTRESSHTEVHTEVRILEKYLKNRIHKTVCFNYPKIWTKL